MNIKITQQAYGKSRVCLSVVKRHDDRHDFIQLVADIALDGQFEDAYRRGDNHLVVPTDTMKNTVYALARKHGVQQLEPFAVLLANHFYDSFDHVSSAQVFLSQQLWQRVGSENGLHRHAFIGGSSEQYTCEVISSGDGIMMRSGLSGLQVLKTAESGFVGFLKDPFTTLPEINDRIFATTITAHWLCRDEHHPWHETRQLVRKLLLDVFSHQFSPSVQKTLYDMASSVLAACPEIDEISLSMPNQHHHLADLEKIKLNNENDIFVPSSEPFGVISATLRRVEA